MTAEEHKAIVSMFAFQQQKINLLVSVMKSKGILEADDLSAFEFAARADIDANGVLAREVASWWATLCQVSGVVLPAIPPSHQQGN
jgi:hypothetical protein